MHRHARIAGYADHHRLGLIVHASLIRKRRAEMSDSEQENCEGGIFGRDSCRDSRLRTLFECLPPETEDNSLSVWFFVVDTAASILK